MISPHLLRALEAAHRADLYARADAERLARSSRREPTQKQTARRRERPKLRYWRASRRGPLNPARVPRCSS
jgi:hypothetical protein